MMSDQSILDNTTMSTAPTAATNPHEIALQSLCKQLLKSKLFRGFYVERRYVENVSGYRDIVSLQKSEKSLDKMLRDIRDKLQLFYSQQNPQMWIGITSMPLTGITTAQPAALDTHLWVELNDLAFGQYWFSIKSIRFRENEIILKLKEVQPVEEEEVPTWTPARSKSKGISNKTQDIPLEDSIYKTNPSSNQPAALENQIELEDFTLLLQQWWLTIKQTIYQFMAQDISKENLKGLLRFLGLLLISLISGAFMTLKFLGIFTLRLIFELSRLTHVLTPIILQIIEMFNKIIGGFYILLAMIWRDTVVKPNQPKYEALEYRRPMYPSIEYNVKQRRSTLRNEPSSARPRNANPANDVSTGKNFDKSL